mgnify:CR=1 FL=1
MTTENTEHKNDLIEWDGAIGVEDRCDICTKRMIWWIRLDNGQIAKVADVNITVDPFPPKHGTHLSGYHHQVSHPNLKHIAEQDAYAEAAYRAGKWAGEMLLTSNLEEITWELNRLKNALESQIEETKAHDNSPNMLFTELMSLYQVLESHDVESLDCDRCGDTYCDCVSYARKRVREILSD